MNAKSDNPRSGFSGGIFGRIAYLKRRLIKMALDLIVGVLSIWLVLLSFQEDLPREWYVVAMVFLAIPLGRVLLMAFVGAYIQIWHHIGLDEITRISLWNLAYSVVLLFFVSIIGVTNALLMVLTDLSFTTIGIVTVRALRRIQIERRRRKAGTPSWLSLTTSSKKHRILIVGAGKSGSHLLRELHAVDAPRVEVVGFLDDDWTKQGSYLDGLPVLGPVSQIEQILNREDVTELILAMPSAPTTTLRRIVQVGERRGIAVRSLPGVERLISGGRIHSPGVVTLYDLQSSSEIEDMKISTIPNSERASRVLVTGGAGYVGSHLTRMLLDRGYTVRVLDNLFYGEKGLIGITNHPRLEIVKGDICNIRDVSRAVQDVSKVIALAAIVGDPACRIFPEETFNLNYESTKILIEACNFYSVERLVFASSCSVYGASERELLTEKSPLNPVSLYARTRILSENVLFDRAGEVEPVILRLATVFGISPRMRYDLVVNTLTIRAIVDGKITIFGGEQWRPNVHCRDVARAFILAMEAPSETVSGEIFNVGSEDLNHTIRELGEIVSGMIPSAELSIDPKGSDPRDYRVGFGKIRDRLGFRPVFSIQAGVQEIVEAVETEPSLSDYQSPIFHNVKIIEGWMPRPVIEVDI